MKKFIILVISLVFPLFAAGQAQIDTKKVKIADFTQKITKVVLTGNQFYDASLKGDVTARWHLSPFEFCTMQEYEELKSKDSYYFLMTVSGQFKKETEPGLTFLTLVKGGAAEIKDMFEVVSFPFASADDPSGREFVFLPLILDAIQLYVSDSMENDIDGYVGLPNYTMNITKSKDMSIVFSESELAPDVTPEIKNQCFDEKVLVLEEDDADEYVSPKYENTLVGYVVAPSGAKPGSFCYKMLLDTQNGKLYYFRKHRISKKAGAGFLAEDIRRICAPRKK